MRILCHLHTRGSLCLTLCTPREPGVPGVAGLQLSKFRHQPRLINSQREEGASVDIWSLTARKWLGMYMKRNNQVFLYVLKYQYFLKCHFLELPLLCLSIKYVYGAGRRLEWWEICLWDAYTTLPATHDLPTPTPSFSTNPDRGPGVVYFYPGWTEIAETDR